MALAAGMQVEGDCRSSQGAGNKPAFAFRPADCAFNRGHVRRILCFCESRLEGEKWALALADAVASDGMQSPAGVCVCVCVRERERQRERERESERARCVHVCVRACACARGKQVCCVSYSKGLRFSARGSGGFV